MTTQTARKDTLMRARRRLPKRINGLTLEEFRATLPEYRRYETFRLLAAAWDTIKGQWIASDGRAVVNADITAAIKFFALDIPSTTASVWEETTDEQGKVWKRLVNARIPLIYVKTEEALAEQIDLTRPILIGQMVINKADGEAEINSVPLDGFHRLHKAALTGVDHLPAYLLTPEETNAISLR